MAKRKSNAGQKPWKPSAEDLKKAEALASRGMTQEQIALALGISQSTYYKYKSEESEFSEIIKRGQAIGIAKVADALRSRVEEGDTTAMIFFLKARAGWSDRQEIHQTIEHSIIDVRAEREADVRQRETKRKAVGTSCKIDANE